MSQPDIAEKELQVGNNDAYWELTEGGVLQPQGSAVLKIPTATAPSQTTEGQLSWDSDDDALTVGTGSATAKTYPITELTPGVGISGGTGTVFKGILENGPLKRWRILIDLTGLNCGGTAGDIIGTDGAGVAYLCQVNGTVVGGQMTCLEVPTTGDPDIDLYAADEATGVEDTAITDLTETQLVNAGDATLGSVVTLTAFPTTGQYLYLVCGTSTAGTYDAGKLLIELYGY